MTYEWVACVPIFRWVRRHLAQLAHTMCKAPSIHTLVKTASLTTTGFHSTFIREA